MTKTFPIPVELKSLRQNIEASIKPYIKIKTTKSSKHSPWQSNFCGTPYLPLDFKLPFDVEDFVFLAQINFAELPPLPHFPEKGICQFYISNGFYSSDEDNCRILFFEEVVEDPTKLGRVIN